MSIICDFHEPSFLERKDLDLAAVVCHCHALAITPQTYASEFALVSGLDLAESPRLLRALNVPESQFSIILTSTADQDVTQRAVSERDHRG
jgi:hypothetical protein